MAKIVVFAQQKGGAGKTTLLVQTAVALAARGCTLALVDLDPQRSLTRWAAIRNDPEIPVDAVPDWQAGSALRKAAKAASHVLVDCPGNADILLRAAVRQADLVVIPCQPSPMDAWATGATLEMCAKEKTRGVIVLNRVPPRGGAMEDTLRMLADSGADIAPTALGNRVAYSTAFLQGRAAAEVSPRSRAAVEAEALADDLMSRL